MIDYPTMNSSRFQIYGLSDHRSQKIDNINIFNVLIPKVAPNLTRSNQTVASDTILDQACLSDFLAKQPYGARYRIALPSVHFSESPLFTFYTEGEIGKKEKMIAIYNGDELDSSGRVQSNVVHEVNALFVKHKLDRFGSWFQKTPRGKVLEAIVLLMGE